jgi:uncharacterized protein
MGIRLILFLFAVWVIYLFIRRALRNQRRDSSKTTPPAVDMVRCDLCGTHLPAPEALSRNGKHYCSRAHLKADREKTDKGV